MPVYKDEKNGRWYVMVRYEDWKGQRKQKCKRGFATKREELEWERTFQQQNAGDLDMTFPDKCLADTPYSSCMWSMCRWS